MIISPSSRGEDDFIESRIPWLKKVPSNWITQKVKYLFTERVQKGFPDEPLLAATQTQGVVRKEMYETRTVTAQKDLHLLKLVEVGDFVISLRSFQGGIEYAHNRGIISPAYTILKPRSTILPRFYAYLLKSKPFIESLSLFVTGIREGQNIDYTKFSRSELPVPPLEEQQKIVNFIQQQDRRIRRLIKNKKRLISILKEQRLLLFGQLTTCGIGHQNFMSVASQWIYRVPSHWSVKPFSKLSRVTRGASPRPAGDPAFFNGDFIPWVTVGEVTKDDNIYLTSTESKLTRLGEKNSKRIATGTLLLTNSGATLGVPKILAVDACANDGIVAFERLSAEVNPEFAYFYLSSLTYRLRIELKQGGTQPNLNTHLVKNLPCPIPSTDEQLQIVQEIKTKSSAILLAIQQARTEIGLIEEYQQRLIADAVTGKIDLRSISLESTDESPEEDRSDISDNGFDADAEIGAEEDELLEEAAHAN